MMKSEHRSISDTAGKYNKASLRMIEEQLVRRGIRQQKVLDAFLEIPRHLFVCSSLAGKAYDDCPLPIGKKQTISQPYMVALMLESLELDGKEKVLEIGAGSGYQTALLSRLAGIVYSVEIIPYLAESARDRLEKMGIHNVIIKVGDGTLGWAEQGPYQAIVVSAGSPEIPAPLKEQLADRGRLLIPVGNEDSQVLKKVIRNGDEFDEHDLTKCIFVKLVGDYGWKLKRE